MQIRCKSDANPMQIPCKSHAHHDVKPTQLLEKSCRLRASIVLPPLPWFSYDPVSEAEEEKEEEEEEGEGEQQEEEEEGEGEGEEEDEEEEEEEFEARKSFTTNPIQPDSGWTEW